MDVSYRDRRHTEPVARTRYLSDGWGMPEKHDSMPNLTDIMMHFAGESLDDSKEEEEQTLLGSPIRESHLNSNSETYFTMLKAIIGSGVLFLPRAFSDGGILFSTIFENIIAFITGYCIILVINSRGDSRFSYAELGEEAYGAPCKLLVQFALISFQLGLVVSYFIFVSDTVINLIRDFFECSSWSMALGPATVIPIICLIQIPVACLRNLKQLAIFTKIANACIVVGIVLIVITCFKTTLNTTPTVTIFNPPTAALFVGTSVLSFEGVALMIPIKESMRNPEDFNKVLVYSVSSVCVLYTTIGLLGALAFGSSVQQNILLSIGAKGPISHIVSVLYSIAILCSLPLQAFPAYRAVEKAMGIPSGKQSTAAKWTKNCVRTSILIALATAAVRMHAYLHYIVAVIGGVSGVTISFTLPAFINSRLRGDQPLIDGFLIITGVALSILVTSTAVYDWMTSMPPAPPVCIP